MSATIDTTVLDRRMSDLAGALFGRGSGEGEVQVALKTETGQLAGRIADTIGPRTKDKATKQALGAVRAVFILPPGGELMNEPSVKFSDWTWLYSSPRALVGIRNADYQTGLSGQAAMGVFRAQQVSKRPGPAYKQAGVRGAQHIIQVNKTMVSPQAANFIKISILEKMGQLSAAFYNVAIRYVPSKKVDAFPRSRMAAAESAGKSRVTEAGMATASPVIEFTVNGKGLESSPKLVANVQRAVNGTAKSMEQKLKKLGKGAKYVFETGQVYFDRTEEGSF